MTIDDTLRGEDRFDPDGDVAGRIPGVQPESGASPLGDRRHSRRRELTPLGALLFFALIISIARFVVPALQSLRFSRPAALIGEFPLVLVFPLAYAFYPQVFTKRFWHFPANSWKWLVGLAGVETLAFVYGHPVYSPLPRLLAFETVVTDPLLEEVVRAVTISPFLDRWKPFWAILLTGVLNTLVHPHPLFVVVPVFLQTLMFVSTNRSIPATALGHALMNGYVVFSSGIQ